MMQTLDSHPGSVEFRVLSDEKLKQEQKVAVEYVQEMLQLKVSFGSVARGVEVRAARSWEGNELMCGLSGLDWIDMI